MLDTQHAGDEFPTLFGNLKQTVPQVKLIFMGPLVVGVLSIDDKRGSLSKGRKKPLLERFEDFMVSATFAEAGEVDTARQIFNHGHGPKPIEKEDENQMEHLKTLLVDDEVEFVQSLAERLKIRDLGPDTAFNGEEALSFIQRQEPDVMVLDLKMPGMDGLEVLREVRKTHPEIQVIMLTGHGTKKHEDEARKLGAFGFLEKPVNIDTLVKEIWAAYKRKKSDESDLFLYAKSWSMVEGATL